MLIHSFIHGQNSRSQAHFFSKKNPFTNEELHQVYSADLMEAVTAIQQAQKFYVEYSQTTLSERETLLRKIQDYAQQNKFRWAQAEALDQGLPLQFVLQNSVGAVLSTLDEILKELSNQQFSAAAENYRPVGVVCLITSWNLSLRVIAERLLPAIAAGNTVVIKVSSASPVTAALLAEIVVACDLPKNLMQIIVSDDPEVKKVLVSHPAVKAISFVGQLTSAAEVLKLVAASGLQQFKKIQISSGTKNTAAALEEPTPDLFSAVMDSFLIGQGQLAWNSARLFVLEKNEKNWRDMIQEKLSSLRPSESIEDNSPWTPCVKPESYKNFADMAALAKADQARLIQTSYALSENQKKCFLPVTFTQDMSNCSTLQQDQVFSPLYILSSVKYPFDIPKYSNVSYFGFAAHLWGLPEKLSKVAAGLDVGLVCYNQWSAQVFGPVQALKQSGAGLQDYRAFGAFFSNVKRLT